ncbi:mRNA biogenesis factor-domain-containing protein [Infundibulicybe gibba]|nr:mRNA biogenesis factor-domain-containing protein [Infundibulicybe gibba]
MAKGKKLNPADDYRKALRKKELKKAGAILSRTLTQFNIIPYSRTKPNALRRATLPLSRRIHLVGPRHEPAQISLISVEEIEQDIENLEAVKDLSPELQTKLVDLKAELEKINRKKAEYVAEHPEQRRLVYRPRKRDEDGKAVDEIILPKRNLFKKNGLPRHPERSIYYDPQMNPFGVAPPGMPYAERPLRPDEVDSEDDDENEDDIAMPEGPPPGAEEVDSDDDIPMPEGPPPGQILSVNEVISHSPPNSSHAVPPPLPLPIAGSFGTIPPPPPPPPGYPISYVPVPPPGFPRVSILASRLPLVFPAIPHHTYQLPDTSPAPPRPPPPMNPTRSPEAIQHLMSSAQTSAATVSAAPQLRDFKKEATAFVPTALKRKKADASSKPAALETTKPDARPDLLQTLKDQFGPMPAPPATKPDEPSDTKKKDDYAKFVEEMGDMLT